MWTWRRPGWQLNAFGLACSLASAVFHLLRFDLASWFTWALIGIDLLFMAMFSYGLFRPDREVV